MGLIKGQAAPPVVTFQWRDLESSAKQLVADAQQQAAEIVRDAHATADSTREAARVEGFRRGHDEGLAQGREEGRQAAVGEYAHQIELTLAALNEAIGQAVGAKESAEANGVRDMVELSIAIARRVIKRQVMIDPEILAANLTEALALTGRHKQLRIAIHPSQRQVLADAIPRLQMEWPATGVAQIVEDASLSPGGCRVMMDHGQIDADLDAQLDRVIAGLMPPTVGGQA